MRPPTAATGGEPPLHAPRLRRRRRGWRGCGRRARALAAAACGAVLAGCGARNAIWLEPGTAQPVVFRIATQRGGSAPIDYFYGLTVATCGGHVMWTLQNASTQAAARPIRLVYGEAPPGYYSSTPPEPLRPGCYRATVSGPASVEFTIESDGRVVEREERGERAQQGADSTARP